MSQSIREDLNIIRNLAKKMPKTINEAMEYDQEFEPEYAEDVPQVEDEKPADIPTPSVEPQNNEEESTATGPNAARQLIDDIRKKALRAMAELADTPECSEYENLKRIWQLCDKAVSEKQEQREIAAKQDSI